MEHSGIALPLSAALLLCISTGCIPVAYVCPDVDVFSADLRDLSYVDHANADTQGVITVEQTTVSNLISPIARLSKQRRIRLLETDAKTVRHLSCGLAARCELACVTTFGSRRMYESHLKAYRRGYRTLAILPWKPLKHADWQPARALEEQEIAVDLLSDSRTELLVPVPAPKLAEDGEVDEVPWRSLRTTVDRDTSLLLADEYAWLAAFAQRAAMYAPRSTEIAAVHERLRQKARYWRERDVNAPIVRPLDSLALLDERAPGPVY